MFLKNSIYTRITKPVSRRLHLLLFLNPKAPPANLSDCNCFKMFSCYWNSMKEQRTLQTLLGCCCWLSRHSVDCLWEQAVIQTAGQIQWLRCSHFHCQSSRAWRHVSTASDFDPSQWCKYDPLDECLEEAAGDSWQAQWSPSEVWIYTSVNLSENCFYIELQLVLLHCPTWKDYFEILNAQHHINVWDMLPHTWVVDGGIQAWKRGQMGYLEKKKTLTEKAA